MIFMAALAFMMTGCVTTPRSSYIYDQPYDEGYYDYRGTPSYDGYYYVRIIFIGNIPYYVDDDRYIRPIPPRLYDHFRHYPYSTLGRPPVFSRDREVRDGYPVSRIIYLDGVPYNVGNDRKAQPLPERLQQHFRYSPADRDRANDRPVQPPAQSQGRHDNGRNNEPPPTALDQLRKGMQQPPQTDVPGHREGGRDTTLDSKGRLMLSPEARELPLRRDRPNAGQPHADTTNAKAPDRAAGKQTDKKPNKKSPVLKSEDQKSKKSESRQKSGSGKQDKQGDDTRTDEGSDNNKDNGKKPRNGREEGQGNNERRNGNWRD
jgi:hypothetical protein